MKSLCLMSCAGLVAGTLMTGCHTTRVRRGNPPPPAGEVHATTVVVHPQGGRAVQPAPAPKHDPKPAARPQANKDRPSQKAQKPQQMRNQPQNQNRQAQPNRQTQKVQQQKNQKPQQQKQQPNRRPTKANKKNG